MGRKKDAERRKRREQRMAERMQQTQPQNLLTVEERQDAEKDKGTILHDASALATPTPNVASSQRILEPTMHMEDTRDQTADINESVRDARVLVDAMNTIPESDSEGMKSVLLPILTLNDLYRSRKRLLYFVKYFISFHRFYLKFFTGSSIIEYKINVRASCDNVGSCCQEHFRTRCT